MPHLSMHSRLDASWNIPTAPAPPPSPAPAYFNHIGTGALASVHVMDSSWDDPLTDYSTFYLCNRKLGECPMLMVKAC